MKKYLIFLLLLIVKLTAVDAQQLNTLSQKTSDTLTHTPVSLPQESVYLQFDKANYAIGDTVWFKGIITIGDNHQLSELSNVLYVELIDSQDSVVNRFVLYAEHGLTYGDFPVTTALLPGEYGVRAYTKFMLNKSPDFFFNTTLQLGVDPTPSKPDPELPPIELYPEGGKLINGIRSKVAVKVIVGSGLMENSNGIV
jgi:hypothetical protein